MTATVEGRPQHQVILSPGPPRENRLPKAAVGAGLGAIDISGMVTRVRTVKTISAPNGTFEVECTFQALAEAIPALSEQRSLNLVVVPQNLCEISLCRGTPGSEMTSIMQGVVTRVFERTALSEGGEVSRTIVLAGEDWGNILANHDIAAHYFSARLQGGAEIQRLQGEGLILSGTPGQVEKTLYDAIFVKRTQALLLKTNQVFDFDIDPKLFNPEAGFLYQGNVWMQTGKFWTVLRSLADEPWNELYADWDQKRRKFVLHLRPRPFDRALWEALETHEVLDEEVRYHEEALADDERLNWTSVVPLALLRAAGEENVGFIELMYSRFDIDDAERHGARHRSFPTAYSDRPSGAGTLLTDPRELGRFAQGQGQAAELFQDRAQRVWNWYNINHRLWRGTWVLRGRPEIHIGTRAANQREPSSYFVRQEGERRVYYIETVVQDYLDGHHYWTHLAMTRGQLRDGFVMPWVDGRTLPG